MSRASFPFVALDGATAGGTEGVRDLATLGRAHTLVVTIDGAQGDAAGVVLYGSHDGEGWFQLTSLSQSVPASGTVTAVSSVSQHLVQFVRVLLQAGSITGSPSVTATVASEVL